MINKLTLTIINSETFTTIEFAPNDSRVGMFDDHIELCNCFIDWRLPQNEHLDELIRGQEVRLKCTVKISFDEIAKAALYEDGAHIRHRLDVDAIAFKDTDVYEAIEVAGKLAFLTNQVLGMYSITGNEDKRLRVF